jgi:hypothetical protein
VTGLIVGTAYNAQTTLSGILVMVMVHVKWIAIQYARFVNPYAIKVEKTTWIHFWWYQEIPWIPPAQRNSDPPHAYISVLTESSQ